MGLYGWLVFRKMVYASCVPHLRLTKNHLCFNHSFSSPYTLDRRENIFEKPIYVETKGKQHIYVRPPLLFTVQSCKSCQYLERCYATKRSCKSCQYLERCYATKRSTRQILSGLDYCVIEKVLDLYP
jgi:hypothetical protein